MMGNDGADGTNDDLCICCGIEPAMDGMRWGQICHAMIRPRTSRNMPSTNIRHEDTQIVDKILDNYSPQATASRLRELVSSFSEIDQSWANIHYPMIRNQTALDPLMSEEDAAQLRQRIFEVIDEDDIEECQRLLRRGFPLPGGLWLTILEGPGTPSTVILEGKIQVSRSFPGQHLVKMMSKMNESQIASIDWEVFVKTLCTLFPSIGIRRRRELRFQPFRYALGRSGRTNFCYASVLLSQITEFTGNKIQPVDFRKHSDEHAIALDALPHAVEHLSQSEYGRLPWLGQWREATENWCNPSFLKRNNEAMIQVRNGHLHIRIRSMDGRTKIRKIPMDISVWQGIISAQLSPPGSPQHDRLWLLLENWNLGSVAPAIPDEPDRTAAKTLVKQILAEDRIHLVQSKQAIEIQGTSGASYLIKTKPKYNSRDSLSIQGSTPRRQHQMICIHQPPEQLKLPIGDQIGAILLVCLEDLDNHPLISTITEFLRRNDLLRSQNASNFSGQEQQEQHLPYLQRRNLRALQENWRRNHREAIDAWDREDGHIEHERLPTFPITDDVLQNLEPRQRIPRLIANALVALRGSPIGAQARVPCLPGGFFTILRLTNMYQTSEEIDLLRTLLPVCGWQLERDEDNEVQIWRRRENLEWDRATIFNNLAPLQEVHNPQGRPWWATIEEMVAHFMNQTWAMRRWNHPLVEHESAED